MAKVKIGEVDTAKLTAALQACERDLEASSKRRREISEAATQIASARDRIASILQLRALVEKGQAPSDIEVEVA
jgi:hypothetical protein